MRLSEKGRILEGNQLFLNGGFSIIGENRVGDGWPSCFSTKNQQT